MAGDAAIATFLLAGMCLAMWFLARIAKKRMGVGAGTVAGSALRVVGKRPLDQKASLYVIEIAGGRHILIGAGTDGTVTKIDDISPEEYAVMTADADAPAKPRLRVATESAVTRSDDTPSSDGNAVDIADEAGEDEDAQRFATVGESFQHFLGKAKDARKTRSDRRASGE